MTSDAIASSRALESVRDQALADFDRFAAEANDHTAKFLKRLSREFEARTAEFLDAQRRHLQAELNRALGEIAGENLRRQRDVEDARRQLEEDKKKMEGVYQFQQSRVKLDVGGFYYTTSLDTLRKDPDSLLAVMFSGRHKLHTEDGRYFVDRNGEYFSYILDFLRDGAILLPANPDVRDQILKEAEYFRIRLHPPFEPGQQPQYYTYSWEATGRPPPGGGALTPASPYNATGPLRPAQPPLTSPLGPPPLPLHFGSPPPPAVSSLGIGNGTGTGGLATPGGSLATASGSGAATPLQQLLSQDGWDRTRSAESNVISADLLTLYANSTNSSATSLLSPGHSNGVHRWDVRVNRITSDVGVGVAPPTVPLNRMIGTTAIGAEGGWCYHSSGNTFMDGHHVEYGDEFQAGDVISVRLDLKRRELSFSKNGRDLGLAFDGRHLPDPRRGQPFHLAVSLFGRDSSVTLVGQDHDM